MQHGVHGHRFEVVEGCPVNYCTNKSQENLGKKACCNQKMGRKINFCFSVLWENKVYKTEFSDVMKNGRRVITEEECYYKSKWDPFQADK